MTSTPSFSSSAARGPPARNPQAYTSNRERSRYLLKTWMVFSVPPIPSWLQACRTRIFVMQRLAMFPPFGETGSVHLFVIDAKFAGFDFFPPPGVLAVPTHGALQRFAEGDTR